MNWYRKKEAEFKAKWKAAINSGDVKEATKMMVEYVAYRDKADEVESK